MGRLISELLLWQHTHTDTHTQTRQQYKQTQFIQSLVNEHVTQGQRAALRPLKHSHESLSDTESFCSDTSCNPELIMQISDHSGSSVLNQAWKDEAFL